MVLLRSLFAIASVTGLVYGQSNSTIDPNSIPIATRDQWCQSQTSSCPLLCLQLPGTSGSPKDNTCDPKTLAYTCVCNNGMSPNASQYSLTIPYFICTQQDTDCVNNCNGDSTCQSNCRSQHPCGAQNPKRVNVTTTAGSTPTTAAATTSVAAFTGVPDEGLGVPMSVDMAPVYGLVVVVGAFLAGFTTLI
ncbi:hypothetical protein BO70DRAFT_359598 [Aspergillus heteromorphus CBS 117.55]|uniref:DUF7707 domain-containing protein n=1 Tax=Aspergillus heteromorphus CBS 117.55 TaxID=1448321 RepID=A0A317WVX5_9EURO|nr:uncharacterized protein BO70DRAFT_359598 [Aspergillus heteromorphus CBS 117.55]PWY89317.1 hypothetical protein BO70DRAFT_359598 [Aspergillus heteromorphus CBS 117.55]